jgi:diguanylate cyclase (GGDEF)-like protein
LPLNPDILLLAGPEQGDRLARNLRDCHLFRVTDPYEAVGRAAERPWHAVLIATPQPDLPRLIASVRQLQSAAAVLAICPPADEPDIRRMLSAGLTDYYIDPPTPADYAAIVRRAAGQSHGGAMPPGRLTPDELARLVDATVRCQTIRDRLSGLVARWVGSAVHWVPSDRADISEILLTVPAEPRHLVRYQPAGDIPRAALGSLTDLRPLAESLYRAAQRTENYHRMAITDHLTGAYNRRYFYELVEQVLDRVADKQLRVSLLLLDIDNFKHYNDTFGHAIGDQILREAAHLMKQVTRSHDIVARIGGDEFAILFWDSEPPRTPGSAVPDSARILAQRFHQAVAQHEFPSLGPEAAGALTISGGLASYPDGGSTCTELLRSADSALLAAKRDGKNAIRLTGEGA